VACSEGRKLGVYRVSSSGMTVGRCAACRGLRPGHLVRSSIFALVQSSHRYGRNQTARGIPFRLEEKRFSSVMRILVVDDELAIGKLISSMLAILGHEAILADNGLEAVNRFASGRRIDLVITDLNMPVMDGYEAIRQIRKLDPNAMIVSMSAAASGPPADTIFLEKPFTLAALRSTLDLAVASVGRLSKAG
jgi:CheY-like chemotaxis protein